MLRIQRATLRLLALVCLAFALASTTTPTHARVSAHTEKPTPLQNIASEEIAHLPNVLTTQKIHLSLKLPRLPITVGVEVASGVLVTWNSKRLDSTTGFLVYKYRCYSPELGRFISRDPIEENGGVNLYAFAGNRSLNAWDRLGLSWGGVVPGLNAPYDAIPERWAPPRDKNKLPNASGKIDGILELAKKALPTSYTAFYGDARLWVMPFAAPGGTIELYLLANVDVVPCCHEDGTVGGMAVGSLGFEINGGIGTSVGGNSGVRVSKRNKANGSRNYHQKGVTGGVKKPTVPYRGWDDGTATRRKTGANFQPGNPWGEDKESMRKCITTVNARFSVGISGFASVGSGVLSFGGAFEYQIGQCSTDNGCSWTIGEAPTVSIINGMGTGMRIQAYGRATAEGTLVLW